jgi:hypothetical protein
MTTERPGACANCGVRHRVKTYEQCVDGNMSERVLQDRVVGRAKRKGWKVAHAGRGIAGYDKEDKPIFVTPMAKGWPDLFMLNPRHDPPVLVIELKREDGVVEPDQLVWLDMMNECGIPAVVVRPSDLRLGRVKAIL